VDKLFDLLNRVGNALSTAGIPYRVIGGMAAFIHVDARAPVAARLTNDIDIAISRADLAKIRDAVKPIGLRHRHVAGVDMLVDAENPKARGAVHLVFTHEKVRPEYVEAVPDSEPVQTTEGVFIAPILDLVIMKLTSFRLKDKVHIQDLDGVGLITPEIEAGLSPILRERLAEVRATE
jgi:hypothetical protein